jgi:succinate dehydrogenase / fumarate reductase flavoprotein subunit
MKHSLAWVDDSGGVRFDYRPVQQDTGSGDVERIPPQIRAY